MNRENALLNLKRGLAFTKVDCYPNQLVAVQGEQKGLIYHVENGWTKVSRFSDDGREYCIDICAPGNFIGLPTLFNNNEFPVSITAISPCRITAVKKSSLESFLLLHPQIMAVILAELGDVVFKLRGVKIAANQQDAYGQVNDLLVHFAHVFGTIIPDGRLIPFNLTQQDIADFVGLSRPRVSICLKGLLELGYIHRQGRYFVVPDSAPETTANIKHEYVQCVQ